MCVCVYTGRGGVIHISRVIVISIVFTFSEEVLPVEVVLTIFRNVVAWRVSPIYRRELDRDGCM
jgi:hypothetical protein